MYKNSKRVEIDLNEESVSANAAGFDAPIGMKDSKKQLTSPSKTNDYIKQNERETKKMQLKLKTFKEWIE